MRVAYLLRVAALVLIGAATQADAKATQSRNGQNHAPQLRVAQPVEPKQAYCRKYDRTDPAVVMLGIDRTIGEIRQVDRDGIDATYQEALSSLKDGDRLVVFTIHDHQTTRRILFDDCLPGVPAWCLSCKPADRVNTQHDAAQFRTRLDALMADIRAERGGNAARSAIASTVSSMLQSNGGRLKKVVLMSDLLDSETMNLSPPHPVDAHERQTGVEAMRQQGLLPDLDGVSVVVRGFGRSDISPYPPISPAVMSTIVEMWRAYFRRAGANADDIRILP